MGFLPVHGSRLKLLCEVALAVAWCVGGGLIVLAFNHLPCLGLNKAGGEDSCAAMGVGKHRRLVQEQRRDITRHRRDPSPTRHRRRSARTSSGGAASGGRRRRPWRRGCQSSPATTAGAKSATAACAGTTPRSCGATPAASTAPWSPATTAGAPSSPAPTTRRATMCGMAMRADPVQGDDDHGGHGEFAVWSSWIHLGRPCARCPRPRHRRWHRRWSIRRIKRWGLPARMWGPSHVPRLGRCSSTPWAWELRGLHACLGRLLVLCDRHVTPHRVQHALVCICRTDICVLKAAVRSKAAGYFWSKGVELSQQVNFSCHSVILFICRHGSGKAVADARVDRQPWLKPILRFGIGDCGPILLNPVKLSFYLRFKTTILEDTGRSDSRGERRLAYRSARTRTLLDASIVATSRGPSGPDGPRAPDGSVTYVFRYNFAVTFSCHVIWEFVFPTWCNVPQ